MKTLHALWKLTPAELLEAGIPMDIDYTDDSLQEPGIFNYPDKGVMSRIIAADGSWIVQFGVHRYMDDREEFYPLQIQLSDVLIKRRKPFIGASGEQAHTVVADRPGNKALTIVHATDINRICWEVDEGSAGFCDLMICQMLEIYVPTINLRKLIELSQRFANEPIPTSEPKTNLGANYMTGEPQPEVVNGAAAQ